jgi:outer membrane protein assembly factor BamB
VRLDRRTGTEQWRQKSLQRRQLSQPILYRGRIVVADLAGFVHWFDAATGDPIARVSIGKKQRVSTPLVVAGDLLLVFSDEGELTALRAPGLEAK